MKKGLIFDLDGVITDTAKFHYEAWCKTIEKHNISLSHSDNEKIKGLSREKTLEAILVFNKKTINEKLFEEICNEKNNLYVKMLENSLKEEDVLPGIREFIKQAHDKKLKLAIASSSKNAPLILKKTKLFNYFDYISNPSKIEKGKPYPDIYLDAAKGLKLTPNQCIGFEDAIEGVRGLSIANMDSVGICWGNQDIKLFSNYSVNFTNELKLEEVLSFFKKYESKNKVTKEAFFHTAYGKYAYQNSEDKLTVILRVKKNDIKRVVVRVGDPFDWRSKDKNKGVTQFGSAGDQYWNEECPEMASKFLSDDLYDYFKAKISTKTRRLRYAFEVESFAGDIFLYGEHGFASKDSPIDSLGFTWGFLHEGNLSESPKWVSETIWYQIFPERFANGDKTNDNEGTLPWGSQDPATDSYFGGDLRGIIDNLDHIIELGCNGIYMTPIFKANTNHKYDTEDYLKIDEHFGDEKILTELIEKSHAKGIKIMFDAVFNHSGSKFSQWLDVLKHKEKSEFFDWFFVYDSANLKDAEEYKGGYLQYENQVYETFAFTPFMPRLNVETKSTLAYLKTVTDKWTKMGIDAWRLDVANEPPLNFWRKFRKWVKDINNEVYILGEIWYDSNLYLQGDTFDSVMNYTLRGVIQDSITQKWDANKFSEKLSQYLLLYTDPVKQSMFNLLGSHDTPRFLNTVNHDIKNYLFGYKLLFSMLGSPCIYYGDEIGIDGPHDPGCRKCMEWNKSKWNMEIYNSLKNIIKIRKEHPVLASGEYEIISSNDKNIFIMKHYNETEIAYSISNFSNKSITIDLSKIIMTQNLKYVENKKDINEKKFVIGSKDLKIVYN